MDVATLIGTTIAAVALVGGLVWDGGRVGEILQPAAGLIVVGGTMGAVLVSFPLGTVADAVTATARLFTQRPPSPEGAIDEILGFAGRARHQGLLSIERLLRQASDPLLRQGLGLIVDGQDPQLVRSLLELKVRALEERLERIPRVLEAAGGYAPTVGILGAVLGLIHVLQELSSLKGVGSGIATAFVATLYGVGLANLLLLPLAEKLRLRQREELIRKEMIVEGVLSIQEGLSPRLLEDKLRSFHEAEGAEAAA